MIEIPIKTLRAPFDRPYVERLLAVVSRYESHMVIICQNKIFNAKSMLGLLSMGRLEKDMLLQIQGEDEAEAAQAVKQFLNR